MPVRVRVESKEVLLLMKTRPFLSHKRADSEDVASLRRTLGIYGTGGWKDTEDLRLGDVTDDGIRRAINEQTGGFIWWGTPAILESDTVNKLEISTALRRQHSEAAYPVVPLFVGLSPGVASDRESITAALAEYGEAFLSCNGLEKADGESTQDFNRRVSERYLHDALKSIAEDKGLGDDITAAFRIQSAPDGDHDLTFDWRSIFDIEKRVFLGEGRGLVDRSLANARDAFQATTHSPRVELDLDLPLPIAFLVGFEWRITSRLRLSVKQRTGTTVSVVEGDGRVEGLPRPVREILSGQGPAVLVASCGGGLGRLTGNYAAGIDAREIIVLHATGELSEAGIRGLARSCASELRDLNNKGVEKHLLMLGPTSLAVFTGAASNGSGKITIPFWNGSEYVEPLIVGI